MATSRTVTLLNRSKAGFEAIRAKLDSLGKVVQNVPVEQYPNLIESLNKTLTTKSIVENGTYSASSDGADGYSSVTVNVDDTPDLQTKSVTITSNGSQSVIADSGYDGLERVNVTVNVDDTPDLQTKSVTITSNGSQSVIADSGYDGLERVNVTVNVPSTASSQYESNLIRKNDTKTVTFSYTYPSVKVNRGNFEIGKSSNDEDGYRLQPFPFGKAGYNNAYEFNSLIVMGHSSLSSEYKKGVYQMLLQNDGSILFNSLGNVTVDRLNTSRIFPKLDFDRETVDGFYYIGTDSNIYFVKINSSGSVATDITVSAALCTRFNASDDIMSYFALGDCIYCNSRVDGHMGIHYIKLTDTTPAWAICTDLQGITAQVGIQVVNTPTVVSSIHNGSTASTRYNYIMWMLSDGSLQRLCINGNSVDSIEGTVISNANVSFNASIYINSYPNRRYNVIYKDDDEYYVIVNGSDSNHINILDLNLTDGTYTTLVENAEMNRLGLLFRLQGKLYQVQFLYGTTTYDMAVLDTVTDIYRVAVPDGASVEAYYSTPEKVASGLLIGDDLYDLYEVQYKDLVCVYDDDNIYCANEEDEYVMGLSNMIIYTSSGGTLTPSSKQLYHLTAPYVIKHK